MTLVPLAWLLAVTLTAGWQKIFALDPRLGFLAHATVTAAQVASGTVSAGQGARIIFNDRLDAVVAGFFMLVTVALLITSVQEWLAVVRGKKPAITCETAFVETAYV